MSSIGVMAMPADFRYRDVFLKGKPQHDRFDLFRIRHPSMDVGRRAKIFSPFDALKGFNEAIASKDVLYRERVELSDEDRQTVNRARRVQRFLSQPFAVAEQFTGVPGVMVSIEDTIKGFKMILDGEVDYLPEQAFLNVGTIEEAIEKGKKLLDAASHKK